MALPTGFTWDVDSDTMFTMPDYKRVDPTTIYSPTTYTRTLPIGDLNIPITITPDSKEGVTFGALKTAVRAFYNASYTPEEYASFMTHIPPLEYAKRYIETACYVLSLHSHKAALPRHKLLYRTKAYANL